MEQNGKRSSFFVQTSRRRYKLSKSGVRVTCRLSDALAIDKIRLIRPIRVQITEIMLSRPYLCELIVFLNICNVALRFSILVDGSIVTNKRLSLEAFKVWKTANLFCWFRWKCITIVKIGCATNEIETSYVGFAVDGIVVRRNYGITRVMRQHLFHHLPIIGAALRLVRRCCIEK